MTEAFYSREHQWIRVDADKAYVGITDFAQQSLGDVVYVELPAVGTGFSKGEQAAVVESVKTASEVYTPIAGVVGAVNTALAARPELVNNDPEGEGWFFTLQLEAPVDYSELMTEAVYAEYVKDLD